MKNIKNPYSTELIIPFLFSSLPFVKKLTVNGIIGKTQGVSRAMRPPKNPSRNMVMKPFPATEPLTTSSPHCVAGLLRSTFEIKGEKLPFSSSFKSVIFSSVAVSVFT